MIDGLKLRVTSKELVEHCLARSTHHKDRANTKASQLIRDALNKLKNAKDPEALAVMSKTGFSNYSLDPEGVVESLENDIRTHNEKALIFKFFADHLFDEDYTLQESDLKRLEMLK